jgi:hypothetical protein
MLRFGQERLFRHFCMLPCEMLVGCDGAAQDQEKSYNQQNIFHKYFKSDLSGFIFESQKDIFIQRTNDGFLTFGSGQD